MKTVGKLFLRIAASSMMVLITLAMVLPFSSSVYAAPILDAGPLSDDFNRCALNTSVWTFENPAGLPNAKITGAYTGDSTLTLTVPPGGDYTFSNTNQNAPRVMQNITDGSFEVEVKFNSAVGQPPAGAWNMQGILVRDTTSTPGTTKWLRFELDTKSDSINYYVGYLDESASPKLTAITGPQIISSQMTVAPVYLRVKYDQAAGAWSIGYGIGAAPTSYKYTFTEAAPGNIPTPITFNANAIGVFAASTGSSPIGITSQVDYFRNMADAAFVDDNLGVTVNKVGLGTGTVTTTCAGADQVTVTASPAAGSSFVGWSGDVTSTQASIPLTMNKSYNLTATFSSSTPIEIKSRIYIPALFDH